MHDLQQRLCAVGFLDARQMEDAHFCARTHSAVVSFQESYGLRPTGECDEQTWSSLNEASWTLGERLLFLRSPNIRGDDVAELQSLLNRMGFDCGRVDGIFGPRLVEALSDFQRNMGLESNGICAPELVVLIRRMGLQTGDGPGIAVVREGLALAETDLSTSQTIVVGTFQGGTHLVHEVTRVLQHTCPLTTSIDADAHAQAQSANVVDADVYIGFETALSGPCVVSYYEVPDFFSVGGRNLANRLAKTLQDRIPELQIQVEGVRHPVLRETRMPAVLCTLAPSDIVNLKVSAISRAVADAMQAWLRDPAGQV